TGVFNRTTDDNSSDVLTDFPVYAYSKANFHIKNTIPFDSHDKFNFLVDSSSYLNPIPIIKNLTGQNIDTTVLIYISSEAVSYYKYSFSKNGVTTVKPYDSVATACMDTVNVNVFY